MCTTATFCHMRRSWATAAAAGHGPTLHSLPQLPVAQAWCLAAALALSPRTACGQSAEEVKAALTQKVRCGPAVGRSGPSTALPVWPMFRSRACPMLADCERNCWCSGVACCRQAATRRLHARGRPLLRWHYHLLSAVCRVAMFDTWCLYSVLQAVAAAVMHAGCAAVAAMAPSFVMQHPAAAITAGTAACVRDVPAYLPSVAQPVDLPSDDDVDEVCIVLLIACCCSVPYAEHCHS
jgi:hypothetical protein